MRWGALTCGLVAAACFGAAAQQQDACTVEGQVVKAGTGEPLRKALVVLRKSSGRNISYSSSTGENGRFLIANVEPGSYRVSAERNGYLRMNYGQRRPNQAGTVLTLEPGERRTDIDFSLIPFGVISGRVFDEDGEPLARVRMQAMRSSVESGRRELVGASTASTDDRGEYRIFGLPPGKYYVSAAPSSSPGSGPGQEEEESYVPFFYPGVTDPSQAAPLPVQAGGGMHGVDFRLVRMRTARVSGRVVSAPAGPRIERGIVVFLLPRNSMSGARSQNALVDPQGNFEIRGVPPGAYVLTAFQSDRQRRLFARQPIDVGASTIEGINLVLLPGMEIAGRVRFDDGAGKFDGLRVMLVSGNGNFAGGSVAPVKADGSFVMPNVAADEYRLSVLALPEDSYLKTARLGGMDVLEHTADLSRGDVPGALDIVLSTAGGHVEGAVLKDNQQPAAGATVVLVPDGDRRGRLDLFRTTSAGDAGRFVLRGIPPGDYRLFAWEDVEPGAWLDPDFLRDYERAGEPLSVSERGRYTPQLKVIPAANSGN